MMGYRVRDAEDVLLKVILHLPADPMYGRCDSNVIAVVTLEAVGQTFGAVAVIQVQAFAHVGVVVPAVDHAFLEAVDRPHGLPRRELKIARLIEPVGGSASVISSTCSAGPRRRQVCKMAAGSLRGKVSHNGSGSSNRGRVYNPSGRSRTAAVRSATPRAEERSCPSW